MSNGRVARLYVLDDRKTLHRVRRGGEPFEFDLQNLRGNGTGVGCADLGDGPRLVGLQALPDGAGTPCAAPRSISRASAPPSAARHHPRRLAAGPGGGRGDDDHLRRSGIAQNGVQQP